MKPSVIVKLLVDAFGISEDEPTRVDRIVFEQIRKQLRDEDVVVEEYRTLMVDDEVTDEDDIDTDFGDDPVIQQENEPTLQERDPALLFSDESSGSTYYPSPPKKNRTKFPEGYLADAYKIWTKQPRGNDPPQWCPPGVALDMSPRVKFTTVKAQKRLIKNKTVVQNFEKMLKRHGRNRKVLQERINNEVRDQFIAMRQQHGIIHDRTLQIWAMSFKAQIDPNNTLTFKASKSCLQRFKKKNKIVSRMITHKVGSRFVEDAAEIEMKADDFVTEVRRFIEDHNFTPEQIINADQSRFAKELRSGRTLAIQGAKKIYGTVGSVAATTHSYMIMPVLVMDGTLLPHMYVLVSEPSGKFPANMTLNLPNVKAYASKSPNMTKRDLKVFLEEVLWPDLHGRNRILLLVDSWTANKDDALYNETVPEDVEFHKKLIPAKCTGLVQPADVFFFRPFKSMVRFITDTIVLSSTVKVWQREQFLRIQSFVHFQFSANRFRQLIQFAFFKCGYTDGHPGSFQTPSEYCLESGLQEECFKDDCVQLAFIRCAHCERCLCVDHGLLMDLHVNCT